MTTSSSGRGANGCDTTGFCDAYNVTDHVAGVAKSDFRRIFVIGDPEDANTLFKYQKAFAEKLKTAGHDVTLVEAQGRGPQRHSLQHMTNRTLGWCNAGFDSGQIAELIRSDTPALMSGKKQADE